MKPNWTEKEIAALDQIMLTGGHLKQNLHLLPGRSLFAASTKCRELNIKRQTVEARAIRVMSDGVPRTAAELAPLIGATRKHIATVLFTLSIPGDDQEVHISGVTDERRSVPIFVSGKGENQQSAIPISHRRALQGSDTDLDRKYRSACGWWPHADPVVIAAMNAMVHAGRAAA